MTRTGSIIKREILIKNKKKKKEIGQKKKTFSWRMAVKMNDFMVKMKISTFNSSD